MIDLMKNVRYFINHIIGLVFLSFIITNALSAQNSYDIQTDGEVYRFGYSGGQDKYRDFLIPTDYDTLNDFNQITFALRGGDGGRRRVAGICTEPGGKGAKVTASFAIGTEQGELAPGGTIRIIVGQQGGSNKSNGLSGAGGGGGSAVLYRPPGLSGNGDCIDYDEGSNDFRVPSTAWDTDCWILLAVAGGGGGAYAPGGCAQASSGKEGNAGEDGTDGKGADVFGGQGGNNGGPGKPASGGGGGGYKPFLRNERDGYSGLLVGGESPDASTGYVRGGFGYGSGGRGTRIFAVYGGGGGGGYSGGGGGGNANGGGGGGSFVNSNAVAKTKEDGGGTDRTPNNGYVSYLFEDNVDIVDAPVAVCRDTTINVVGEEGRVSVADLAIGSTDPEGRTLTYCAELSLGCVPNLSFNCGDIGEETIYTVRVDNGVHSSTCQANIEVQQGIPGDLVCSTPETVETNECNNVIIDGYDLEIRDFPACDYTVDAYIVKPDGSIDTDFLIFDEDQGVVQEEFDFGTSLLVYTVTYENEEAIEESQSCVVTVNVIDDADSDFECPNNLQFFVNEGDCERLVNSNDLSADYDGCGQLSYTITTSDINAPIVSGMGVLTSFNFPIGINTVEYTLNSVTGEVPTCSFTVEIETSYASSSPQISNCPNGDVLIDIYEGITQEEILAQIDFNVSDDCGIASVHIANLDLSCDKVGVPQNNRKITVTDTDGNTDDCTVDIITQSPPTAISCPDDIIRLADQNNNTVAVLPSSWLVPDNLPTCYLSLTHGLQDLSNNSVVTSGTGLMPTQILSVGTYQASYTLQIVENDFTNCTFIIEIVDCEAPPVACQDATVNLSELPANPADLLINETDNCSLGYTASINESLGCDDVGVNTLIVTITDDFGNESTCDAILTIVDDVIPEITTCPTNKIIYLGDNCEVALPGLSSEITGISPCGGTLTPVQFPEAGTIATTPGIIDVSVDLRDEDGKLSAAPCSVQITVLDNTAPTPACQDVSFVLDENGEGTIALADVDNGSFDNCSTVSLSFDATLDVTELGFDCTDSEVSPVTLYVTDESGNQSSCMASATKIDNLAPTAVCVASLTIGLSESPLLATQLDGGSTDNCTENEDLSLFMVKTTSGSPAGEMSNLGCGEVGDLPITLHVSDQSNNTSTCTVTVEV
ncbi:MAG: hypothetical protein MI974_22070, partial [Chitinophagales bacterium]|nr:hypothetical protein [Chitinophagales bacterium]